MNSIAALLILIIVLGLLIGLITIALRKDVSSLKIMLLGINITLFGGIFAVDPGSSLGGIEYLIVLAGLIISIVGFGKKD